MAAAEMLAHLKHLEIRVWLEGDQLRISAPKGVMSPKLREELVQRKAELVALLQRVANEGSDARSIQCSARAGEAPYEFPLSVAQERMWFLEQLESGTANQIVGAVELYGESDTRAPREALDGLVQRHEALRTTFRTMDGQPVQVIAETGVAPFEVRAAASEDDVQAALAAEARRPFDLERGPHPLTTAHVGRQDAKGPTRNPPSPCYAARETRAVRSRCPRCSSGAAPRLRHPFNGKQRQVSGHLVRRPA